MGGGHIKLTKYSSDINILLNLRFYEYVKALFAGWAKLCFPSLAPALTSPYSQPSLLI